MTAATKRAPAAPKRKPAPAVLLPYQQRWISSKAKVRVCEKSRRVGISWATAAEASLTASEQKGMNVWYVGYNKEMAEEFINDCAFWAKFYGFAAELVQEEVIKDEGKDILTYVIRFASGFRITALSSRPNNLRGKQGFVIIDEAAFHEELGELKKAALALLIWGGKVAFISTHNGVDNDFNTLVLDCRAKKLPFEVHRITLDDALAEGLYQRICLKTGEEWTQAAETAWRDALIKQYDPDADEELFCVPKNSGGAYLARAMIEARMYEAPIFRLEVDDEFAMRPEGDRISFVAAWCEENLREALERLPKLPHVFGEDFGRNADLSVIAPVTIEQGLTRRVPFLVEERNVPFKQQEQVLFYVVDRLPRFLGGILDAGGNGQYLAEVAAQKYGSTRIQQLKLSEQWYSEHLPPFRAAFEDGVLFIPKDVDVLADLRQFETVKGVPKLAKVKTADGRSKGKTRHGDSAIAIALAYTATRSEIEEYGFYRVTHTASPDDRWHRGSDSSRRRRVKVTHGVRAVKGGLL